MSKIIYDCIPETKNTIRGVTEKYYYIRKKIVGYLLENNIVSDKQRIGDFILGNCWSIEPEDYIIYLTGTFFFKDKNNSITLPLLGADRDIQLIHKPKEIPLPQDTLNSLFTNYFEPTPEECTLFELEYGFKWLFDPTLGEL